MKSMNWLSPMPVIDTVPDPDEADEHVTVPEPVTAVAPLQTTFTLVVLLAVPNNCG
jgi:hypothetical protein